MKTLEATGSTVTSLGDPPHPTTMKSGKSGFLQAGLFSLTLLLSSFLLFSIQPLAARLLLPAVGGSSSLWTTAMLFFQVVLLAGYSAAHLSTTRLGRRQPIVYMACIAVGLVVLPLGLPDGWVLPEGSSPATWVLGTLAVMVGLPFFALSTASPTLQTWFSSSGHRKASDPYFLYAAGNLGSVAALMAYPTIIERNLGLSNQGRWWAVGYGLFFVLVLASALSTRWTPSQQTTESTKIRENRPAAQAKIDWRRRGRWLLLSATPSLLLLAVTTHITTDLASFPLLWVLPLLLYLVTHILAFASDSAQRIEWARKVTFYGAFPLSVSALFQTQLGVWAILPNLGWFFAAALYCHSRLAQDRPSTDNLTDFYVMLSVGGAVGGVLASMVAPRMFNAVFEYPLGIVAATTLATTWRPIIITSRHKLALAGLVASGLAIVVGPPWLLLPLVVFAVVVALAARGPLAAALVVMALAASGPTVLRHTSGDVVRSRSFFGVSTMHESDGLRVLESGTTIHGSQRLGDGQDPLATTYYYRNGPVGQVFERHPHSSVGIVGLGTGAIVSYGDIGDNFDLYEIDPVVVDFATDDRYFNYLSASDATTTITVGDGRQGLARSKRTYDILVIDAFSSDSIPTHLLTQEALELYRERITESGVILLHVSNRYFNLPPVIGTAAEEVGLQAHKQRWRPNATERAEGANGTVWVAVTEPGSPPDWLQDSAFEPVEAKGPLWTDDHADPVSALRLWE